MKKAFDLKFYFSGIQQTINSWRSDIEKSEYLFRKMSINVLLTSLAILLVTFSTPTLTSPLAAVREQAHESNSLANLRGFMSDLKTKLRGELALLMALEEQEVEQGLYNLSHSNFKE